MNAADLMAVWEKVSDGPDAVGRLRRFVLDLGMRGMLVPQVFGETPADVPAQVANGHNTTGLDGPSVPYSWLVTTLGQIGDWGAGSTPPRGSVDSYGGDISWFKSGELKDCRSLANSAEKLTRSALRNGSFRHNQVGDVLIAMYGATIGKLAILSESAVTNQAVCACTPINEVSNLFLFLFLMSFRDRLRLASEGGAQPNISKTKILEFPFPLPPLAEQHRIVAKIDELMALCDRLEAARAEREATRDRLAAASLARLNTPNPETFPADARFALDALPALTTRPDQVKQLRQAILNLAVWGKLVPQDPGDEPASALVASIARTKIRMIQSGELRRDKPLPPIVASDLPFDLPSGWAWVRLGEISLMVTSGSRDWAQHYADEGAIFVRMGNLSKGHYRLRLDQIQRVKPPAGGEGTRTRLEAGDVLISITGDVGMLGLVPEGFGDAYINQHTAMVRPMPPMKGRYLPEFFCSPFAQNQFNAPQRGIKNSFRLTDVTEFVVPLPPLAEQRRIVAKVDGLMALCNQLEVSLATASTTRAKLLEATLRDALLPAEETLLEAAQ